MTFNQTYTEEQIQTQMIVPASGMSIYVWQIILESEGEAIVEFRPSGIKVAELENGGKLGASNSNITEAPDEPLTITCVANTTVRVLYDEI